MVGYFEEFPERGHRAAGDHVEFSARTLGLRLNDRDPLAKLEGRGGLPKELGAEAARLDQGDGPLDEAGDDDAGQAGARADIDPQRARARLEATSWAGVEDVTVPTVSSVEAETDSVRARRWSGGAT